MRSLRYFTNLVLQTSLWAMASTRTLTGISPGS